MTDQENSQRLVELDRTTLRVLSEEIQNTLDAVARNRNITIKVGGGSFGGKEATLKLNITLNDSDIPTMTEREYDLRSAMLGLPKRGTIIILNNTAYQLIGFKPRSTKYPIIAIKLSNSKSYKLPLQMVIDAAKERR